MLAEKPRSPVSEHRKVTKSAMEKKRRARINSSLTELKTILAGIMAFKDERFEKMEKADILEMTVNYVRQLQNRSTDKDKPVNMDGGDYRTGVNSCIGEVIRYVTTSDICDTETKTKLLDHLANKVNTIHNSPKSPSTGATSPLHTTNNTAFTITAPDTTTVDNNNNIKTIENKNQNQFTPISIYTTQMPMNSVQTVSAYTPQMVSPVNSIQTAIPVSNVQTVTPVSQAPSQVVQNVPLTILVPANFCTTAAGTTCVIPLTLSNSGTETNVVPVNTVNSECNSRKNPDTTCDSSNERLGHTNNEDVNRYSGVGLVPPVKNSEPRLLPSQTENKDTSCLNNQLMTSRVHSEQIQIDSTSESAPFITKSPDFIRSEQSVFQKYQSYKAPSPFNRIGPVWRPW